MNEKFEIELRANDQPLPIDRLIKDEGIIIGGETDAWPRRFVMQLVPRSNVTRDRLRSVCNIEGWPFPQFRLNFTLQPTGRLLVEGTRPGTLPGGDYKVRVRADDLTKDFVDVKLVLSDKSVPVVAVDVQPDPRQIQLTTDSRNMDAEILRVLEASTLDGQPAAAWLGDSTRRANRRACVLNLLAKLRKAQDRGTSLIEYVQSIFFANTERIYVRVTGGFGETLETLANDPAKPFYREGFPKADIHKKLLERAQVNSDSHELISYRQEGKTSMQAVVARARNSPGQHYAELDIDLGNPLQDVAGFITHITELLDGKPTNHLDLFSRLSRDKALRDVLYYNIV